MSKSEREPLLHGKKPEPEAVDCEGGSWGPVPRPAFGAAFKGKDADGNSDASIRSCMGVFYSVSASTLAIPFLVGSWCWPVLLATMTGVAFSHTAVILSHTLQFALLMAVFTNLVQYYVYIGRSQRMGSHLNRYGPAYIVLISSFFVMVHPTFIVLEDAKVGQGARPSEKVVHACTYAGYGMMVFAAFWAADIVAKLRASCCAEREEAQRRSE